MQVVGGESDTPITSAHSACRMAESEAANIVSQVCQ